jgi:multidrug resistance protein MdtO
VRLARFLRRELAPVPGRLRATLRIVVGCLGAVILTAIVGADLTSHAHWTVTTIFAVSQADAGASLRRAIQRVIGTIVGGVLGILVVMAFADLPVIFVPTLGVVVAFGIFASLTTTVSYVMLLGSLTFVLVAFLPPDAAAGTAIDAGLWRIVAVTLGVVCGTFAQMFLLPEDPEKRLRAVLAGRLGSVADELRAIASRLERGDGPLPDLSVARQGGDDVTTQLDLLTNAESRHPSLRQRHTEQLSLIVEIDRLLTTTVWLVDAIPGWGMTPRPELGRELRTLAVECSLIGEALAVGRPLSIPSTTEALPRGALSGLPGVRPTLDDMWVAAGRARAALKFLDPAQPAAPAIDQPARGPLFTPGFSVRNTEAIMIALKAGIGAVVSYILMHALDWSALLTAATTTVLVSQTSFGATVQKSLLRLGGALLGGAAGIAAIVVLMPNIENLGSLLVVAGLGFAGAAWITAGSARISYMGFQAGFAFAMCVTDPSGPTTNLTVARDRVLGILAGLIVMMLVDAVLLPVRARLAMRPALARALRSIAALARVTPETREYRARLQRAVRLRSAVYRDLATVLRLSGESTLEPDADTPDAREDRRWTARLVAHAQAVFLSLLTLIRHRLGPGFPTLPPAVQDGMRTLDADVGVTLDALADYIDRGRVGPLPDLAARLVEVDAHVESLASTGAGGRLVSAYGAERDHLALAGELVRQVTILRDALAPEAAPHRA